MFSLLRKHLTLAAIIPAFPYTIVPNTLADATQVQADLDWIRTNVNANAQPVSGTVNFGQWAGDLNGTNQILVTTAAEVVLFTSLFDTLSEYSAGVYTASAAGKYLIQSSLNFTVSGVLLASSYIGLNASLVTPVATNSSTGGIISLSKYVELAMGDTIRFYGQRDATPNSVDGSTYFTFASIARIA